MSLDIFNRIKNLLVIYMLNYLLFIHILFQLRKCSFPGNNKVLPCLFPFICVSPAGMNQGYKYLVALLGKNNSYICQWPYIVHKMLKLFRPFPFEILKIWTINRKNFTTYCTVIFRVIRFPKQFVFTSSLCFNICFCSQPVF